MPRPSRTSRSQRTAKPAAKKAAARRAKNAAGAKATTKKKTAAKKPAAKKAAPKKTVAKKTAPKKVASKKAAPKKAAPKKAAPKKAAAPRRRSAASEGRIRTVAQAAPAYVAPPASPAGADVVRQAVLESLAAGARAPADVRAHAPSYVPPTRPELPVASYVPRPEAPAPVEARPAPANRAPKSDDGAAMVIPPFDHQPSGEELTSVRPAIKRFTDAIINGLTIARDDVELLVEDVDREGDVKPMEVWLLWRGFVANVEQFTLDAARDLRRFLRRYGVEGTQATAAAVATAPTRPDI